MTRSDLENFKNLFFLIQIASPDPNFQNCLDLWKFLLVQLPTKKFVRVLRILFAHWGSNSKANMTAGNFQVMNFTVGTKVGPVWLVSEFNDRFGLDYAWSANETFLDELSGEKMLISCTVRKRDLRLKFVVFNIFWIMDFIDRWNRINNKKYGYFVTNNISERFYRVPIHILHHNKNWIKIHNLIWFEF